jgi:hypothetical protein
MAKALATIQPTPGDQVGFLVVHLGYLVTFATND